MDMNTMKMVANFCKEKRKMLGLSQGELAARLGVSYVAVWAWENGKRMPSSDVMFDRWLNELGVTLVPVNVSKETNK